MERLTQRTKDGIALCNKSRKCKEDCKICFHLGDMLDKLCKYEDSEEQGLLIRLPCKIGDTVYEVYKYSIGKKWVSDGYDHLGQYGHYEDIMRISIRKESFRLEDFNRIGINIFLTEEEAEQALAKMKEV